jgi:hypothetical protein
VHLQPVLTTIHIRRHPVPEMQLQSLPVPCPAPKLSNHSVTPQHAPLVPPAQLTQQPHNLHPVPEHDPEP